MVTAVPKVSVSTSGSKGVQRLQTLFYIAALNRFSIHKRIEGGATELEIPQKVIDEIVSVSTSGSKGVQLAINRALRDLR